MRCHSESAARFVREVFLGLEFMAGHGCAFCVQQRHGEYRERLPEVGAVDDGRVQSKRSGIRRQGDQFATDEVNLA